MAVKIVHPITDRCLGENYFELIILFFNTWRKLMITKPTTLVVVGLVINSNNNLEKTRTKLGQLGQN